MGKLKKMITGVVVTMFLCGAMVFVSSNTCLAAGDTYDTALESVYGDSFRSMYYDKLSGSPLEAESPDGVDTANGHLILSRTDLSLDGTGGMDFELNRYYNSNEAGIGHPTVEYLDKIDVDTVYLQFQTQSGDTHQIIVCTSLINNHKKALKDLLVTYSQGDARKEDKEEKETQRTKIVGNESYNVYGISSGWRYDFPWIETVTLKDESEDAWSARPAYLHMGSKGVIGIETSADASAKTYHITGLSDYSYSDVCLEDFNETVDGVSCRYLLRDKAGMRTYFNADGVVVLQKDAHDNTIRYTYQDKIYFKKITDSVGREIVFHYADTENDMKALSSVTVQGKETAGGVAKKTISYVTEEKSYTPLHSGQLHGLVLKSATIDGTKETYGYRTVEQLVNTSGAGIASQRVATNQAYLLNKVTSDGNEQNYEYRATSQRAKMDESVGQERDVATEGFYVTREYSRDTKTGKKSDGTKYDYFQKQGDHLISYAEFSESSNQLWV